MDRLPSDLITLLADFLALPDLRSFRLTSRWAEHETRKVFARRVFHSTKLTATNEGTAHLQRVLGSKGLGTAVRRLTVNFAEGGAKAEAKDESGRVEMLAVLELMPRLETLAVGKFGSRVLSSRGGVMPLEGVKERGLFSRVTNLTITDAALLSAEILSLIKILDSGTRLTWVDISQTIALDGDWLGVVRVLRAMGLERLAIGNLEMYKEKNQLLLLEEGRRAHRAFRGKRGIEHFALTQDGGRMLGAKAVEGGLELILRFLEDKGPGVREPVGG